MGSQQDKSDTSPAAKTAVVLGASGVVGRHLLQQLLAREDYRQVRALVDKRLSMRHPRLRQFVVDLGQLGQAAAQFRVQHVFCCLGSGVRPARRRSSFQKTDYAYPYRAAQLAAEQGAAHYVWISAVGANPASRVFYLRVKGELEAEIARLPLPACTAVRPALVLGPRRERPPAAWLAMNLMRPVAPLMRGPLHKYRVVTADDVAASMVASANDEPPVAGLEAVRYRHNAEGWPEPVLR